jgi:hypothetical protein
MRYLKSIMLAFAVCLTALSAKAQLDYDTIDYPTSSGVDYVYTYNGLVVQNYDNASVYQFIWATNGYFTAAINVMTYDSTTLNYYNYVVYINAYVDTTQYVDLQSLFWDNGFSNDVYFWGSDMVFPNPSPYSWNLADTAMDNLEYQLNHYFGHI